MKIKVLNNVSYSIQDDGIEYDEEALRQIGISKQFDKDGNIIDYVNPYIELEELLKWFEEYDNQVKQYERCQRLGIEFDKDIVELDNQAKVNAERITEIRNLLQ